MRESNIKELANELEGKLLEIASLDSYAVSFEMSKAILTYDPDYEELCFFIGDYNADGAATIRIDEEDIESVEFDEENDRFILTVQNIPDVAISKFKQV